MPDGPNKTRSIPLSVVGLPSQEVKNPAVVFINAPEHLAFRQNLYDQEPFLALTLDLQKITDLAGLSYQNLSRYILPRSLQAVYNLSLQDGAATITREVIINGVVNRAIRRRPILRDIPDITIEKRSEIVSTMTRKITDFLNVYPYVAEYVAQMTQQNLGPAYRLNGDTYMPNEEAYSLDPERTYPKWLQDKRQKEGRCLSLEVRSIVFNPDNRHSSIVNKSTTGQAQRRWAVYVTSGFVSRT